MSKKNPSPNAPNSPRGLTAAERRVKVLEYRMAGASYRQIAQRLERDGIKVSHQTVAKDINRALEELQRVTVTKTNQLRELELARLDNLWFAQYPEAVRGNPTALQLCLQISDRRAKMLGLNNDRKTVKVELEREVQTLLTALRNSLDDETFERALVALAQAGGDLELDE